MVIEPTRTVIIYDEAGQGKDASFKDLKQGMRFRIMESDGTVASDPEGCTVFIAETDSYVNEEDGIWSVETSAYVEAPEEEKE